MNKKNLFFIKGNVVNDNGQSMIKVYNNHYNQAPIYTNFTDESGNFLIGPIYLLEDSKYIYNLNIEISKYKKENLTYKSNDDNKLTTEIYKDDNAYKKYYSMIKISNLVFHKNSYYIMNNIELPINKYCTIQIKGNVTNYSDKETLSSVYVKLISGDNINIANERIEESNEEIDKKFLDDICLQILTTDSDGHFSIKISDTGQYMLVFIKSDFFLERYSIIVNDLSKDIEIGNILMIPIFNSGKLMVKLYWSAKPPDLDLFCQYQVGKDLYCYTFFGNKKCVETIFFSDSRLPYQISSEVIEIKEFSDHLYFFYVRKYFDISNGTAFNEVKGVGVEPELKIKFNEIDEEYDESIDNMKARLLIYSNGFKYPAIEIPLAYKIYDLLQKKNYKYWAAFCINGNEGISSLKIINEVMENEPQKDICLSFYDKDKIISFD